MALAPFFAKAAKSASQVLSGFDARAFASSLENAPVAVAWDAQGVSSSEARATLDLLVDLCSRLYPVIRFVPLDAAAASIVGDLTTQARAINPRLDVGDDPSDAAVLVVVGQTPIGADGRKVDRAVIYAGSDGWIASISNKTPIGSGKSVNIFGACVAACLAAANVFRAVFHAQLSNADLDTDVSMSVIDMVPRMRLDTGGGVDLVRPINPDLPDSIDIGEAHLVGIGAIGHATVWALRRTRGVHGTLHLVDGEEYDDTNPQRYVGTTHDQRGAKATSASDAPWVSDGLTIVPHDVTWAQHVSAFASRQGNWRLERVALAVDTAADRVRVQAALPRVIHNAWTRPENIGVARHNFLEGPCVCCFYMPNGPKPNYDDIVADALRIKDPIERKKVRFYIDTGAPLDADALSWIGDRMALDDAHRNELQAFLGKSLQALYTRGICGGVLLTLGDGEAGHQPEMEVPAAFQSALAGILLAAEIVVDAASLRSQPIAPRTEINLLRPLRGTLNAPQLRPPDGSCLCQDSDYQAAYRAKYGLE
ncbi:MAG: E2 ligase fold family C protein [Gemmatimonadota bacterium]